MTNDTDITIFGDYFSIVCSQNCFTALMMQALLLNDQRKHLLIKMRIITYLNDESQDL